MFIGILLGCCVLLKMSDCLFRPGIEVPHAVAIMKSGEFGCQGINLSGNLILTAPQCIEFGQNYEIRAGFLSSNGSVDYPSFLTYTNKTKIPDESDSLEVEKKMAFLILNNHIPNVPGSNIAKIPSCFTLSQTNECFILLWNLKAECRKAVAVAIRLEKGMCRNSTIYQRTNSSRSIEFCGEADVCLPDISGASLNCHGKVTGMVLKSACSKTGNGTQFVFLDLLKVRNELSFIEKKIFDVPATANQADFTNFENNFNLFYRPVIRATNSTCVHSPTFLFPIILLLIIYCIRNWQMYENF